MTPDPAPQPRSTGDTWERGSPYERYVGRWSRQLAPLFLSWLNIPMGRRWLDVGCGTGALCAAIVDRCSPASVAGVEPSEGFLKTARENLAGRVALHQGCRIGNAVAEVARLKAQPGGTWAAPLRAGRAARILRT